MIADPAMHLEFGLRLVAKGKNHFHNFVVEFPPVGINPLPLAVDADPSLVGHMLGIRKPSARNIAKAVRTAAHLGRKVAKFVADQVKAVMPVNELRMHAVNAFLLMSLLALAKPQLKILGRFQSCTAS